MDSQFLHGLVKSGDERRLAACLGKPVFKSWMECLDSSGHSPLSRAAAMNRQECARILLSAGANPDGGLWPGFALFSSCAQGHHGMARLLLESGADPLEGFALHAAAANGHGECVKVLAAAGADLASLDKNGNSPLHCAVDDSFHRAAAAILLELGADLERFCSSGSTPLGLAAQRGHEEAVSFFIENGALVDAGASGEGPLVKAARSGSAGCVALLIKAGANLGGDSPGESPAYKAAVDYGSDECRDLIFSAIEARALGSSISQGRSSTSGIRL